MVPAVDGRVSELVSQVLGVLRGRGLRPITPADERLRAGVVATDLNGAHDLAAALARHRVDVGGYP